MRKYLSFSIQATPANEGNPTHLLYELGVHCDLLVHGLQSLIQLYALQHLVTDTFEGGE